MTDLSCSHLASRPVQQSCGCGPEGQLLVATVHYVCGPRALVHVGVCVCEGRCSNGLCWEMHLANATEASHAVGVFFVIKFGIEG